MKHFLLLATLFAISTSNVFAQEETLETTASTATSTQATTTPSISLPTPERASTAPLNAQTQARITNLAANISNRFDAVIARLDNITNRLERRIEKVEATGVDLSDAKARLQNARTLIVEAMANMSTIDAKVADALGGLDPLGDWQAVRTTYQTTKELVIRAHGELRATIALIKATTTS